MRAGHAIPKRQGPHLAARPKGGSSCHLNGPAYVVQSLFVCLVLFVLIYELIPGDTPGVTAMMYEKFTRFINREARFLAALWKGSDEQGREESTRGAYAFHWSLTPRPP